MDLLFVCLPENRSKTKHQDEQLRCNLLKWFLESEHDLQPSISFCAFCSFSCPNHEEHLPEHLQSSALPHLVSQAELLTFPPPGVGGTPILFPPLRRLVPAVGHYHHYFAVVLGCCCCWSGSSGGRGQPSKKGIDGNHKSSLLFFQVDFVDSLTFFCALGYHSTKCEILSNVFPLSIYPIIVLSGRSISGPSIADRYSIIPQEGFVKRAKAPA